MGCASDGDAARRPSSVHSGFALNNMVEKNRAEAFLTR
jgi:hypothetical protein